MEELIDRKELLNELNTTPFTPEMNMYQDIIITMFHKSPLTLGEITKVLFSTLKGLLIMKKNRNLPSSFVFSAPVVDPKIYN